jgi:predicted nuclease of restriction endonuclease-like (RecB) superfamily
MKVAVAGRHTSSNLVCIRTFTKARPDFSIRQQAVGELPWRHNLLLLTKLKTPEARFAHAARAVEHGWSRNVLALHIEQRTLEREGKATTNFELTSPESMAWNKSAKRSGT